VLKHKPTLAYVNPKWAMFVARFLYNWEMFGQENIRKSNPQVTVGTIPEIVTGRCGTIEDLHVEPVAFKSAIFEVMREYIFHPNKNAEDNDN
jgi:hypothetical protein